MNLEKLRFKELFPNVIRICMPVFPSKFAISCGHGHEQTNQISITFPKFCKRIENVIKKTLGTSVINSPMSSPPILLYNLYFRLSVRYPWLREI